jgi:hypothetical protein
LGRPGGGEVGEASRREARTEEGAGRRRQPAESLDDEAETEGAGRRPSVSSGGVGRGRVLLSWRGRLSGRTKWMSGWAGAKSKALLGWAGLRPRPSKKYTLQKFPTPRAVARLACVPAPPLFPTI